MTLQTVFYVLSEIVEGLCSRAVYEEDWSFFLNFQLFHVRKVTNNSNYETRAQTVAVCR